MYGIYANIWGILMANVTLYIYIYIDSIYGSYGLEKPMDDLGVNQAPMGNQMEMQRFDRSCIEFQCP